MQKALLHSAPALLEKATREPVHAGRVNAMAAKALLKDMKNSAVAPEPEQAPLPVVLIHGLLSTPREFGLISLPLQSRGVPLIIPVIKGYTEADRSQYVGWEAWVEAACDAIREQVGVDQPFVLGGLCSGGMVAAAVAARGEFNIQKLVMMSPSFGYDGWARTIWWRLRRLGYALGFDHWVSIKESPPYGIKNEKIRKWVERDMQQRATSAAGPSSLPLWAIRQSERLMNHVVKQFPGLRIPTVVIHSRLDEICSLGIVNRVFETLPKGSNRLVVLENSYHMITIDNDRQQVTAELLKCSGQRDRIAAAAIEPRSITPSPHPAGALTPADSYTGALSCPTP
ncbi:MAG: alpha/beta hydrolase [Rhizobacter sp.]